MRLPSLSEMLLYSAQGNFHPDLLAFFCLLVSPVMADSVFVRAMCKYTTKHSTLSWTTISTHAILQKYTLKARQMEDNVTKWFSLRNVSQINFDGKKQQQQNSQEKKYHRRAH